MPVWIGTAVQLASKAWDGLVSVIKATGRMIKRIIGRKAFDAQEKSDADLHQKVESGDVEGLNQRLGYPSEPKKPQ